MRIPVEKGTENKILRGECKPVKSITPELRKFIDDMIQTMDEEEGVGIAAPQVGRNIRLVICKFNPGENNELVLAMANPEFLEVSKAMTDGEEGCLSLPGVWGNVKRHKEVLVKFMNAKNQEQVLELTDFNARIIQHEKDHIDGVLFVDRATDLHEVKPKKKKGAVEI